MSAEVRLQARHPGGSYLVQAPAGSGKTELLTQRILALLAIVDEPEEILALTFTRKAAAEMRKRVLESLCAPKPAASAAHKMETWQLAQQAMQRSDEQGWHLNRHPVRLRIMTIDSLMHALARQLPLLSGLGDMPSPSEHAQAMYREAAESALNASMRDFPEAAESVLLHQDHNAVAVIRLLADMLGKREQWLDQIASHGRDMTGLRQMLESNLAEIMLQKLMACDALIPLAVKGALPDLMRFAGEQRQDASLLQMHAWPDTELDELEQWQQIADFLLTAAGPAFRKPGGVNVRLGFPAAKAFAEPKDRFKQLLDLLAGQSALADALHELRLLPASPDMDDDQWQVLESLFLLLVLANQHLQQCFARQGEADFTEIALRAMDALGANDAAPGELLMKLDYRIHHILVDEFQDTSLLQMHLLQCLTAGWQEGDGRHRSLFMVGDPMQSIYRFRKAEVGLFLNATANAADLPLVEALQLERNFRSSPAIVDWVNAAFQTIFPDRQDVISGAVSHAPAVAALSHTGSVNLHLQHGMDAELEADTVVALVQQALNTPASDGSPQRIGILARSRKHLHAMMPALTAAGIAFRAINILPLNSRPEVRLLRALLRALLHPADRQSWVAILRAPCCGLESYDLHVLLEGHDQPVWQLIEDESLCGSLSVDGQSRMALIRQALAPCMECSGKVPVRDLLDTAWLRLSMPSLVDATASLNIDTALSLIAALEAGGRIDFSLFDERLQKLYAAPDVSEAAARVELLTMHGAKGLQWDVVVLPGLGHKGANVDAPLLAFSEVSVVGGAMPLMSAKASTRQKDALYDMINDIEKCKDNNELQRLLYVACTRPETTLHMLGHVSEQKGEASSGSLLQLILSHDEGCFGAQINLVEPAENTVDSDQAALTRVCKVPALPLDVQANHPDQEIEYVWAGVEAAPIGNAVHAALQHIAELGVELWHDDDTDLECKRMTRMLIFDGLSGQVLKTASARCADALRRVLTSDRGRWMLSGNHQDSHSEWALSLQQAGGISHGVIDRSFIDADHVRWIIDYKTASHEGGEIKAFLDDETARHAPQLQRYAAILRLLHPSEEVITALYFPVLDVWKVI